MQSASIRRIADPGFWTLDRLLAALAFLLIFVLSACMNFQSDTWWLLRMGQDIVATGHIPTTDPYSSTIYGQYWPNHEWLSASLFYGLYALGGTPLLVGAAAALVTATWAGVYRLCEGPPRIRALALLLGVLDSASGWSLRPQIFSVALFVAVLLLLRRPRLHWWYVPLFLVWANLHAGVASGGMVLAAATGAALAGGKRFAGSNPGRWVLISAASALATLANPLGWRLWAFVVDSAHITTRQYIQEWQPPSLADTTSYPYFLLLILLAAAVWAARKTWRGHIDWTLLALAGLLTLLSMRSLRHTSFFTVAAVPLLTRPFRGSAPSPPVPAGLGRLHGLTIAALAALSPLLIGVVWSGRGPALGAPIIAAVRACPGTLFNTFEFGGQLMWFVQERPVFIDNRYDPYPNELFIAAAVAEERASYQGLFERYAVSCALVPVEKPLYPALQRDGWREIGRDDRLAVLARE